MPDIQLLPELSACLGVTIDELFDLTDDTRLHRISSMLENTRMLDEAKFRSMEQFLRGKTETNPNASQYFALLSELYCHMAGGYREKAAHNAREALRLDPDDKWNHSLLRMAEDGSLLDWNFSNHTKRILYYRCFLREHPGHVRGCLYLLDELLADHLLEEAEKLLAQMGDRLGDVRSSTYAGRILWELVAPVMSDDGTVDYYLPEGRWTHLLSGETRQGPGWFRETCGYDTLPLYLREGYKVLEE